MLFRTPDPLYRYSLREPVGLEYVSPSAYALAGYTPEELCADPELAFNLVHPDDLPKLAELAAGGGPEVVVIRWITRDGRTIWTEQHNVVVRDADGTALAVEGVARDVTRREEALARLRESEQRYRGAVVAMAEGIVLHDADGRIVTCNPAAERILGIPLDDMRGLTSLDPRWDAVREDGSPFPGEEHPAVVTRLTGQPVRNQVMGVGRPDGSRVWLLVNTQPLAEQPGAVPYGIVISFADIHTQQEANAHLREALRAVRTLSGVLPICSYCKKIRTDAGYWEQIEAYIRMHTDAEFSHGICPGCLRENFPQFSPDRNRA